MSQHEYRAVGERPSSNGVRGYQPGSLDKSLEKFKAKGVKVIGFWRSGGAWVFKTMRAS